MHSKRMCAPANRAMPLSRSVQFPFTRTYRMSGCPSSTPLLVRPNSGRGSVLRTFLSSYWHTVSKWSFFREKGLRDLLKSRFFLLCAFAKWFLFQTVGCVHNALSNINQKSDARTVNHGQWNKGENANPVSRVWSFLRPCSIENYQNSSRNFIFYWPVSGEVY